MLKVYWKQLGDVAVLCLQGEIVTGEITALRDAVLSQSEATSWILDLTRVSRIDARGLGLLLELREQTLARGQEFQLRNVNRLVRQVFEITHLDSVFEVEKEIGPPAFSLYGRPTPVLATACCA
jgi:anti-anti-sigma factor